jgi:methenyltetrahydrofolate cyclohydrolase
LTEQVSLLSPKALLNTPTNDLLDAFGAGQAAPGSGSAAALMGLLAAKLIMTVCTKSLEKPECAKDERTFRYIADQVSTELEPRLKILFEQDARNFDQVVALRRLRDLAADRQERGRLSRRANDSLESATNCAIEIADLCMKLIDHGIIAFDNGWHAIRGDSGAAISAAMAGVMSGIFIINLNLKSLKDRKSAEQILQKCGSLYEGLQAKQISAFSCVTSLNKEAIEAIQLELGGLDAELPVTR